MRTFLPAKHLLIGAGENSATHLHFFAVRCITLASTGIFMSTYRTVVTGACNRHLVFWHSPSTSANLKHVVTAPAALELPDFSRSDYGRPARLSICSDP